MIAIEQLLSEELVRLRSAGGYETPHRERLPWSTQFDMKTQPSQGAAFTSFFLRNIPAVLGGTFAENILKIETWKPICQVEVCRRRNPGYRDTELGYEHLEDNQVSVIERGAFQDLKQLERLGGKPAVIPAMRSGIRALDRDTPYSSTRAEARS
ncbi:hypothetical protein P7K49_003840 [Saguinus oedipus]|uniref:Uncharacterized protein n=1 Tax=Saguinus oedipus TaxID=9490 RepID=A0ABQ9W5N9_SAGOE|nr:hypothetical protein P7K49_003840 [Saguinus oedipus]